jgi:hypothetical protein
MRKNLPIFGLMHSIDDIFTGGLKFLLLCAITRGANHDIMILEIPNYLIFMCHVLGKI